MAWTSLYDFGHAKGVGGLGQTGARLQEKIDEGARSEALQSRFASAGRDIESLGLGMDRGEH